VVDGPTERDPNLIDDRFGARVDVAGREAQEPDTFGQKTILSPVVIDKACSMGAAVVLEAELPVRVIEVGPT